MSYEKYKQGMSFYVEVANPLVGDRTIPIKNNEWINQIDSIASLYGLEKIPSSFVDLKDKPNPGYLSMNQEKAEFARDNIKARGLAKQVTILELKDGELKNPL
ncbi:MAG: hypothetical protein ACOC3Z_02770 [Nanoarchaeota archaeon]